MQELLILANGGMSALSWYTSGKLGKGFVELGKSMAEAGVKEILAEMAKGIFSKETLKELLKRRQVRATILTMKNWCMKVTVLAV